MEPDNHTMDCISDEDFDEELLISPNTLSALERVCSAADNICWKVLLWLHAVFVKRQQASSNGFNASRRTKDLVR
jgi:hypothetical protein